MNVKLKLDWATSPLIIMIGTWIIALTFWLMTPDFVIYKFFKFGRYSTFLPMFYLFSFLSSFSIGYLCAIRRKRVHSQKRFTIFSAVRDKDVGIKVIKIMLKVSSLLIFIGFIALLAHFISVYLDGNITTFNFLENRDIRKRFSESSIQAVTIFKFVSLTGFILSLIVIFIADKWNFKKTKNRAIFLTWISLTIPLTAACMGYRSTILLWIIPYLYTRLTFYLHFREKKRVKATILIVYFLLIIFTVLFFFSLGEYQRRFSRILSGEISASSYVGIEQVTFLEFSFYALSSYFFRTINNGLSLVENYKTRTYLWRILRPIYTGFGIERYDPGGLIKKAKLELILLQYRGLAFFSSSNFSLPGYLFIDIGWLALGLTAIFGYLIGRLYLSFLKGYITSILILPIIIFAIMESWQSDIGLSSVVMLPILTGILTAQYLERKIKHLNLMSIYDLK